MSDKVYVGLTGLASDVLTLDQLLKFKVNMYKLREERDMKPETFSALVSTMLYEKRFGPWFCEPVIAGLKEDNTPFLSGMDLIGAPWRITVGPRGLANNLVELTDRRSGESTEMSARDAIARVQQIYQPILGLSVQDK